MQLCGVFDCAIRGLNVLILRYLRAEYNGTADRVLNMCKSNQQRDIDHRAMVVVGF